MGYNSDDYENSNMAYNDDLYQEYIVEGLGRYGWEVIYHADSYEEAMSVIQEHQDEDWSIRDSAKMRDYRIREM